MTTPLTDPTADPPPDAHPPRRWIFGDYRLYLSIALALLMVCVTVAFVSVVLDRTDLRSKLNDAQVEVGKTKRETECRARLANEVSDRQADAILAIGDLAVALYMKDDPAADRAAEEYLRAATAYRDAVAERGDSVANCAAN